MQTPGEMLAPASSGGCKPPRCYYLAAGGACVWVCCLQTPTLKSKHRVGAQIVVLLQETQQWIQAQGDQEERPKQQAKAGPSQAPKVREVPDGR